MRLASNGVPAYHKVACKDIATGKYVVKHGQVMTVAICTIKAGVHVHTYNVKCKIQ